MPDHEFDRRIADAIVRSRILGIRDLRAPAEYVFGRLGDEAWDGVEPDWRWHDDMSTHELQDRLCHTRRSDRTGLERS